MRNRPDVRGIAVRTCTASSTQVLVRIAVVPRSAGRLCRAGNGGRDRSDPPLSMPVVASSGVGMCILHPTPRGVATDQRSHAGRPRRAGVGRVPAWCGDAGALDGLPVGERVVRRLEAALNEPSARIAGLGATRGGGAGGAQTRTAPNPQQFLGLPGPTPQSRRGGARPCADGRWGGPSCRAGEQAPRPDPTPDRARRPFRGWLGAVSGNLRVTGSPRIVDLGFPRGRGRPKSGGRQRAPLSAGR